MGSENKIHPKNPTQKIFCEKGMVLRDSEIFSLFLLLVNT